MPHYFTLAEANTALQIIKPLMERIQAIRENILAQKPEVWSVVEKAAGNGGSKAASLLTVDFEQLDQCVHQIQETGAVLKDINLGLLDFSAWRADHEVYLCWKYGEKNIEYWHEIEAGFAGRQPIETF
jgi:hypothetical protein